MNLLHHYCSLTILIVHLLSKLFVLTAHTLDLFSEIHKLVPIAGSLSLRASSRRRCIQADCIIGLFAARRIAIAGVHAPQMLGQVLLAREALAAMALAVGMRAMEWILRAAVLAMDLTLVSQETAGVRKSRELLTALGGAFVGTVVLVHVLAPLAFPLKLSHVFSAVWIAAEELAIHCSGDRTIWLRDRLDTRSGVERRCLCRYGRVLLHRSWGAKIKSRLGIGKGRCDVAANCVGTGGDCSEVGNIGIGEAIKGNGGVIMFADRRVSTVVNEVARLIGDAHLVDQGRERDT